MGYQSLQICRLRATRLTAAGLPVTGATSVAVVDSVQSVGNTLTISEGAEYEKKNGCGAVKARFKDCNRVTGAELAIVFTDLEIELLAMMTAATVLTDGGTPTPAVIGLAPAPSDAACPNGVAIEVWTKAFNNTEQAVDGADVLWWRHVWPRVTSQLGNMTLEDAVMDVPVDGLGSSNSQLTGQQGPAGDWPEELTSEVYGVFLTTDVPDVETGLVAYPII